MYPRILICDDMVYSRTKLKHILDQKGKFIIVETETGSKLLKKIDESKKKNTIYKCLFLDLELKTGNTFKILEKIREKDPLLEIILCGGISLTDENIIKAMNLGVKKFIPKPFKEKEVETIINEL